MSYLKPKQHYIDRYDKLTIEDCRRKERIHLTPKKKYKNEEDQRQYEAASQYVLYFDLLYTTLDWYDNKEQTIAEWIQRDTKLDTFYASTVAPRDMYCTSCNSTTTQTSKILIHGFNEKPNRVLFLYECPNGCLPHRSLYNNGEEYIVQPHICTHCGGEMADTQHKKTQTKIVTTETCSSCGHIQTDTLDISEKKEAPDPHYDKDKERFCLSGERLYKVQKEKADLENLKKIMEELQEKEEHKEEYEKIQKIQKLTIPELKKQLTESLKDQPYTNLVFERPKMEVIASVGFTIEDPTTQTDYDSRRNLSKHIQNTLKDTNWRLMSDGITYRLGILQGRLRVYEREEDLLKLVK